MKEGHRRRAGLAGLSLDEILKLSDHEVFARVLDLSECPGCHRLGTVSPNDVRAQKQENPQYKTLQASIGCKNCGRRFGLKVTVPQTPEAYDAIFKMGILRKNLTGRVQ